MRVYVYMCMCVRTYVCLLFSFGGAVPQQRGGVLEQGGWRSPRAAIGCPRAISHQGAPPLQLSSHQR